MKTRFVAYDRLGARRGVLTHILQAEIVPSKNELPTLTLTYPRAQPTHRWLKDSPEVAFEYYHNNAWVEPDNARFKLVTTDFDYLEEVQTRNYTFIGIGEAIRGVYVFGANGRPRNDEGKVQFANATPGEMLAGVWDYAVSRGWKGFTRNFSATAPSGGGTWKNRMSISFAEDTSLESMLMYLSRMGLIDFKWQGRTLHVFNADTAMARDLTTGNNPMKFNLSGGRASIDSAPESNDHENMATHVVVTGEDGLRWVFPTGAVLPEGRREVFLNYSGVDDEGTAQILAAPTIAKYTNSLKNTTRQFQISPSTIAFPFINYGIGDWVLVEKDDGQWERVQIFQLALLINNNGVQGYVSLGDKIDSLLERLNEAVQRVQGGSVNEGTEPPSPPRWRPSAPYGVVTTARTMYNPRGEARGILGVNWAHNGEDEGGDAISINEYIVEYRRKTPNNLPWRELFRSVEQNGTYSWVDVKDEDDRFITYQIRVRAVAANDSTSLPSDIAEVVMVNDTTPPKKPAKPTIKVALAVFQIGTTHRTTTGSLQDVDYAHTIVEMATTANGPWVERETIVPPSQTAYVGGEGYTTRWFRLIAVDFEGNKSEPSDVVSDTAKSIVDEEFILTEIDAGKVKITNAGKAVMENGTLLSAKLAANDQALVDANALITRLRDVQLPALDDDLAIAEERLGVAEGKITSAQSAITSANTEITKVSNRVGPIEAGLTLLNNTTIPNLTRSIDGKTTINRQTTVAANPGSYSLGDRWEQWDKLSAGGQLLKTWRHNGTAWIEEVIAPSYLPKVDIGAGTFGSLDGGRLTANSVSTQSLIVGSFSNLIENGSFEYGSTGWSTAANWTFDSTGGRLGPGTLRCSGITERIFGPVTSYNIPIEYGDSYRISGWVRTTATTGATQGEMCLYYYRGDGSYLANQNFNITDAKAEWKQYSHIFTPNNPEAAYFRVRLNAMMTNAAQEYFFDDIAVVKASDGSLVVNGTITGDHVDAESVGAKVGTFVKVNVENITATATANLNNVVAQRIAAGTAEFQRVDAKNIFVTGTASLTEVVAKRFAADTGAFLTLGVDQLTVTGTANMKDAVADRVFANLFSTRKLMANQVLIGHPGNVIPDPMHLDPKMLEARNEASTMRVTLSSAGDYTLWPSATANTYFRPMGVPQTISPADFQRWIPVKPGEVWRWTVKVVVARGEGWIKFVGRTMDGTAMANPPEPNVVVKAGTGTYTYQGTVPEGCYWLIPEMMLPPNEDTTKATYIEKGSMSMQQVMTPELIVDGAITTKKLTVTEDMTAALLRAKKVEAGEINFNSLFGDSGFIGNLKTSVLVSNAINTDMLDANAITSKHTLTGPLIRSAASGARTEMNNQGIRVLNSSNVELVRLGYGISTGMSVRNPATGLLTPLADVAFGVTMFRGGVIDYSRHASPGAVTPHTHVYMPSVSGGNPPSYIAPSTSCIIMWSASARFWNPLDVMGQIPSGVKYDGNITVQLARGPAGIIPSQYEFEKQGISEELYGVVSGDFQLSGISARDDLIVGQEYFVGVRGGPRSDWYRPATGADKPLSLRFSNFKVIIIPR